ncbi:MAG: TetR/AcrR family transcriptional regulator [Kiritimatiellia bacterium]
MQGKTDSLRSIKHARTRLALMNAFIGRMRGERFEDISIRDICRSAEVSEGTFFNYFPEKINVLNYFVSLMTVKFIWNARRKARRGGGIALINSFFNELADEFLKVNITYEVIATMVVRQGKVRKIEISPLEKRLFFPELKGVENEKTLLMQEFMEICLRRAAACGELPRAVNINDTVLTLMSIMVGTLIAIKFSRSKSLKRHYRRQLGMLWRGLGPSQSRGK